MFVFRCDAGTTIGSGHFFRCLSIAKAARARGVSTRFLMATCSEELEAHLRVDEIPLTRMACERGDEEDLAQTLEASRNARVVFLDGYEFDRGFAEALDRVVPTVVIDDAGFSGWDVSAILNVNVYAPELDYQPAERTQVMTGLRFALLRPEFRENRPSRPRTKPRIERLLLMIGGSDPHQLTASYLDSLVDKSWTTVVIMGPDAAELPSSFDRRVDVHRNVSKPAAIMAECDLAISGAGGTTWELACLGVPMAHVVIAENQERIATAAEDSGISRNLGWWNETSAADVRSVVDSLSANSALRAAMSKRGMELVDGRGALRVVQSVELLEERN